MSEHLEDVEMPEEFFEEDGEEELIEEELGSATLSVDDFEALPASERIKNVKRVFVGLGEWNNADNVRRVLIAIMGLGVLPPILAQSLARHQKKVPEAVMSLYIGCCGNSISGVTDRQSRLLLDQVCETMCESGVLDGYMQLLLVRYCSDSKRAVTIRLRNMRRFTKKLLYSGCGPSAFKQLAACLNKVVADSETVNFKTVLLVNFTAELAKHQHALRNFKGPQLFSAQRKTKINRTVKKANQSSPEEKAAERMSCAQVFELAQLLLRVNATSGVVDYPLVEVLLHIFQYLVQYPRTFPFIMKLSAQISRHVVSRVYVPLQQLFIQVLYYTALPLPKQTLEINPQQYRAKLFDANGEVSFSHVFCVPSQFAKTLQYREALFKLTVETATLYFRANAVRQAVTLPEATNAFLHQLTLVIHALEGRDCPYYGHRLEYKGFQFAFQKNSIRQLKALKNTLLADAQTVRDARKGVALLDAPALEIKGLKLIDEALALQTKQDEEEVAIEAEPVEKEVLEEFGEEFAEEDEEEAESEIQGDVVRPLEL